MFKRLASAGVLGSIFLACSTDHVASKSARADGTRAAGLPADDGSATSPVVTGRVAARVSPQGEPSFIWASRGVGALQLPAPDQNFEAAARQHLQRFAPMYGVDRTQAAALELHDLHDTGRGAVIASFQRRVSGFEVFGERVAVAMDRNRQAIALTGSVSPSLPGATKQLSAGSDAGFGLDPLRAVAAALNDLGGANVDVGVLDAPVATAGSYQSVGIDRARAQLGATGTTPARVKQVLYPKRNGASEQLVPSYYIEVDLGQDKGHRPRFAAYVMAASDASVLWKRDLTSYENFSYRVFADDGGLYAPWDGPQGTSATPLASAVPDPFEASYAPAPLVTLSSLQSLGITDPWLPASATSTLGNNADAYVDSTDPDGFTPHADIRAAVSAPRVFDYSFDLNADGNASDAQRQAAITQLFYDINWFHDWYYAAGFTEAAGNAQFSNYGRGGVENDAILAEGQDASGLDNSNMSTPADGGRPRMQMYLWLVGTSSLSISSPESLAGSYTTGAASFSPQKFDVTGPVVRASPADACTPLSGDYTGKIVLIDRGTCAFVQKAQSAQVAGASAAIIANVADSPTPDVQPQPSGTPDQPISIGVLTLNLADGDKLRAALGGGDPLQATLSRSAIYRDGDIDNQVVAHEWGHYISNRLIFDAAGLNTNTSSGLGEGWADFHALLLTVRAEDVLVASNANWNGVYSVGGYAAAAISTAPYYFGTRRYPYSTDQSKDPLTFKHISNDAALPPDVPRAFDDDHTEVHSIGEVWASMLWECYAALLRDTLGANPRSTFAETRDRMRDYIVAAYKLTPRDPTLLEARDALLAVALANDATDYERFAAAFARRGAGLAAIGPDRLDDTNGGIVESYAVGASVRATGITLADDLTPLCTPDGILDSGETGTLEVVFENDGDEPTAALTAQVTSSTAGVSFPSGPSLQIPPLPIQGTAKVTLPVHAELSGGITQLQFRVQAPDTGAGTPAALEEQFWGNADELTNASASDDAEGTRVLWSVVASDAATPEESRWHRQELAPGSHIYRCASAPSAGTVDFVSPPLDVAPGSDFTLSFRHRFNFEKDDTNNYDGGVIEISSDGGATWNDVGTALANYPGTVTNLSGSPIAGRPAFVGQSAGYPSFNAGLLDFGTAYSGQQVLLRFRVASDAGSGSPGWDIDDLAFTGLANTPFDLLAPQSAACDSAPLATVGNDQVVPEFGPAPDFVRTTVTLNASGSFDAEGDPLHYRWLQLSGPAVVLDQSDPALPSFAVPDVPTNPGELVLGFQLIADDGRLSSTALVTRILVTNVDRPPLAVVGPSATADEGALVSLDGTLSSDPDGDPLSYAWQAPDGITLSNPTSARPAFIAPDVSGDTAFTFQLVVSDGQQSSAPASVTVTVHDLDPAVLSAPSEPDAGVALVPPAPHADATPPAPSPEADAGAAPPADLAQDAGI